MVHSTDSRLFTSCIFYLSIARLYFFFFYLKKHFPVRLSFPFVQLCRHISSWSRDTHVYTRTNVSIDAKKKLVQAPKGPGFTDFYLLVFKLSLHEFLSLGKKIKIEEASLQCVCVRARVRGAHVSLRCWWIGEQIQTFRQIEKSHPTKDWIGLDGNLFLSRSRRSLHFSFSNRFSQ